MSRSVSTPARLSAADFRGDVASNAADARRPSSGPLRLALAANDGRAGHLFAAIRQLADVCGEIDFDEIDPVTKYVTAVVSFSYPKAEWWENYQMHALMQRRRRTVLQRGLRGLTRPVDALLMWGSWFHPMLGAKSGAIPFFNYIDQSRSLAPLEGEAPAAFLRRRRSHELQAVTYRDSGRIFCMSHWARMQTLDAHQVDAAKVEAVGWGPCGIDLSGEEIAQRDAEAPLILHVSNDFKRKGVDFLAAVAERMKTTHPKARFVVVGRDVSQLRVDAPENVELRGPIYDRSALSDLFRRASVFFLPHRFDRSPHVLVEAMSAGLPFVASAQGGPTELVESGAAGVCIPVGDVDGYTAALQTYLDNPAHAAEMGRRGKQLMLARYNWPSVAKRMLALIASSVNKTSALDGVGSPGTELEFAL